MTDIPYPMITQGDAAATVTQIISYLSILVDSINRMFESIDITNLNSNLADKINKSISEHQDLSPYATAAKLKENADALLTSIDKLSVNLDELNESFNTHKTASDEALSNRYTKEEADERFAPNDEYLTKKSADSAYASKGSVAALSINYELLKTTVNKLEEYHKNDS